jgi:YjbE family integral membrane protein
MSPETGAFLLALLQIIWINILLSGDNAVVIALACRSLPEQSRKWGVMLGAGVAVGLRILFTLMVASLLDLPYVKLVGALLLIWIAVQLITSDNEDQDVKASQSLWVAVRVIAVADLVMSLDNVVAIAAAAKGSMTLIVFGLVMSVPLIVFGATLIISILDRYPVLVWAGAALLGWVSGGLFVSDPLIHNLQANGSFELIEESASSIGAILVLGLGWLLTRHKARNLEDPQDSG